MFTRSAVLKFTMILALAVLAPASQAALPPAEKATVSVECVRGSGLIQVNIEHYRKIGNVRIEVKDAKGHTVYLEEGKAMAGELVRRLDKGMFPMGMATIIVSARDFQITQSFEIK